VPLIEAAQTAGPGMQRSWFKVRLPSMTENLADPFSRLGVSKQPEAARRACSWANISNWEDGNMKAITRIWVAVLIATGSGAALAAPARTFLQHAAEGDYTEVRMGRLALDRGESPGVHAFGQRLVHDHGAHLAQVHALATRLHIRVTDRLAADAGAPYRHLQHLRGADFDRMFAQHMVADHREDIAAFEAQAGTGDPATAAFARDTLPTLNEHLHIAEGLAR
jgi:putative membrane protein